VVSFAAQHPGKRMCDVVADYSELARKGALIDYAFHMIVADVSGENLTHDIPALIQQGHRSLKIFTTYDKVRLDDQAILDTLATAKSHGALVCFHAENDGLIRHMTNRLLAQGKTAPKYHALSHPREAEIEAIERMCRFSEFTGQPIMIFHVSTRDGAEVVRAAQARGVPVQAETCPHYLRMTVDILDQPDPARFMCSPPQRTADDQEALWQALSDGTIGLVTSDHAPYRMDGSGKFVHGPNAPFNKIANGMPGLETRLPLMFDAMVSQNRGGVERFAQITATAPARAFGLTAKGQIAPGFDADIALWDPNRSLTYAANDLQDNVGYNPFCGTTVKGLPITVLSRGQVLLQGGSFTAEPGRGKQIVMSA
jgi:dihydropyrimidinase